MSPRPKGSKNKKDKVLEAKNLPLEVKKTEINEIYIPAIDVETVIFIHAAKKAGFTDGQMFKDKTIKYDKQGNCMVTLINPLPEPSNL